MKLPGARASMVLVSSVLIGAMAGVAVAGGGPEISSVTGTARWAPLSHESDFCAGENGRYIEDRSVGRGTATSTEPRLTGDLTIVGRMLMNLETGDGLGVGRLTISDPTTSQITARGSYTAVVRAFGTEQVGYIPFRLLGGDFAVVNVTLIRDQFDFRATFGTDTPLVAADLSVVLNGEDCTRDFMSSFPLAVPR